MAVALGRCVVVGDRSGIHSFVYVSSLGILFIRVTDLLELSNPWGSGREVVLMVRPCSDWNWKL